MAFTALPLLASGQTGLPSSPVHVLAGQDCFGQHKGLGISTIDFKVTGADSGGAALVIENTNRAKGGPARHLHVAQDELFFALQGEYLIEIGQERFTLRPGDAILAPRAVPHAWAYVGNAVGRLLITFHASQQMGGVLPSGLESERHASAGPRD